MPLWIKLCHALLHWATPHSSCIPVLTSIRDVFEQKLPSSMWIGTGRRQANHLFSRQQRGSDDKEFLRQTGEFALLFTGMESYAMGYWCRILNGRATTTSSRKMLCRPATFSSLHWTFLQWSLKRYATGALLTVMYSSCTVLKTGPPKQNSLTEWF